MQEPRALWHVKLNGTLVTLFSETQVLLEYIESNFVIQLRFSTGTFLLSRFQQNLKFSCRFVNIFIQSFSYVNFAKYFLWCKWGSRSFLASIVLCLCVEHYSYVFFYLNKQANRVSWGYSSYCSITWVFSQSIGPHKWDQLGSDLSLCQVRFIEFLVVLQNFDMKFKCEITFWLLNIYALLLICCKVNSNLLGAKCLVLW